MEVNKEDIEEYIFENEKYMEDEIICPYCGYKHDPNEDPASRYVERGDEKFVCEICDRVFLLSAGFDWWFTTVPIESEVEKILEEEQDD